MLKKKILVIDDEEDFCFFLRHNLEQTGLFDVATGSKSEEALALAQREKPDLILLDILMPKVSGPDVAQVLAADPLTSRIPLIFLTAMVTKEEIGLAMVKQIGGYNYIAKPIDTDKLIQSISSVLGIGAPSGG